MKLKQLFFLFLLPFWSYAQPCGTGMKTVIVRIVPDQYPQESSWTLQAGNGTLLGSGGAVSDTICVPANTCMTFTMNDSYGDGMCCNYGNGSYTVFVDGVIVATGGQFTFQSVHSFNCAPGQSCDSALVADTLQYTAPARNSWYKFKPRQVGAYAFYTCGLPNSCNTTLWVYDNCNGPVLSTSNIGTIFYNDDFPGCGQLSRIDAILDTSTTYYIRVGGASNCTGPINFRIQYLGVLIGCTDSLACNYNPLAQPGGPCYYFPSPLCPPGPDLTIAQAAFENSLRLDSINAQNCMVQEQCLTGYGMRTIVRFTTDIRNIGQTDYFIGSPQTHPSQFNTQNCHGHTHYEGYAQYVLYKQNGTSIPVGFKNGFCVMDLACPTGIPAKYGCSNMGITAGCGDIYSSGLDCQWIDITNVPDGQYILAMKVNWDQSPDALGRHELTYTNNWAQVCLDIWTNAQGKKRFTKLPNCAPYVDCRGTPYGNAMPDCEGNCAGTARYGDFNRDSIRNSSDLNRYMQSLALDTIQFRKCLDLSGDSVITVWDAALLSNCLVLNGTLASCDFPRGLKNNQQSASLSIMAVDPVNRTIDIGLSNSTGSIHSFEFSVPALALSSGFSLLTPTESPLNLYIHTNGRVVGMLADPTKPILRSSVIRPLLRLQYSFTRDTIVFIDEVRELVNGAYESVIASADTTRHSVPFVANSVHRIEVGPDFLLYPNPSQGKMTLKTGNLAGNATIFIVNVLGQSLVTTQADLSTGLVDLDFSGLSAGLYRLVLDYEGKRNSKAFVIQP